MVDDCVGGSLLVAEPVPLALEVANAVVVPLPAPLDVTVPDAVGGSLLDGEGDAAIVPEREGMIADAVPVTVEVGVIVWVACKSSG